MLARGDDPPEPPVSFPGLGSDTPATVLARGGDPPEPPVSFPGLGSDTPAARRA